MLFVFHMLDKPGMAEQRLAVRPEHKNYLAQVADRIAFAGPLLADDGETMLGSMLVIDFDHRAAAEAWLQQEPFTRAGVYGYTHIHAFANLWPQKAGFVAES